MMAGIPNRNPKQRILKAPQTKEPIASPLAWPCPAAKGCGGGGGVQPEGEAAGSDGDIQGEGGGSGEGCGSAKVCGGCLISPVEGGGGAIIVAIGS